MQFHKKINGFLAEWISFINAVMAVTIPCMSALVSASMASSGPFTREFSVLGFLGGLVFGGILGILISAALCGVLAVLIDIRNSLREQAGQ